MPQLSTQGIVCSVRHHGEHGAIVRLFTPDDGLVAGYVRGGRSRRIRPILIPSNLVAAEFRARTADQLAGLTVELVTSRAPWIGEPLASAALDWATTLTAATLPEENAYPRLYSALLRGGGVVVALACGAASVPHTAHSRLYSALSALLDAICHAPSARGWATAMVRFELLLLAELGFGLDLSCCAATGQVDDLAYVSPRSARAVSRGAGQGYKARLLPLPPFLLPSTDAQRRPEWPDIIAGFALTGYYLERSLLADRRGDVMSGRTQMIARLQRMLE